MKKLCILFFAFALSACVLVSCGSNESADVSTEPTAADSTTDDEISCDVDVEEDAVEDLIEIRNVTIPAGSSASDLMKAISYETGIVKYVSYDLNNVDMDIPGEYPVRVSLVLPREEAENYVGDKSDIEDDATEVRLRTTFNIIVTDADDSAETSVEE